MGIRARAEGYLMMEMRHSEQYGHPLAFSSLGSIESIAPLGSKEPMPRPLMSSLVEAYVLLEAQENSGVRGEGEGYREWLYRILVTNMVCAVPVVPDVSRGVRRIKYLLPIYIYLRLFVLSRAVNGTGVCNEKVLEFVVNIICFSCACYGREYNRVPSSWFSSYC